MKLKVTRAEVWAANLEDRPAGLAEKLEALSKAGARLEFIMGRRSFEEPGRGVVFLAPLQGAAQFKAARDAGFIQTEALHSVRVEGANQPGLGTRITRVLATASLNLRGFSATVVARKFVAYLALDDEDDAVKAVRALRRLA